MGRHALTAAVLLLVVILAASPVLAQTNEARQDVSNIPGLGYQPEQGWCLHRYYDSLPAEDRRWMSQWVTYKANLRGVSLYDVVGC